MALDPVTITEAVARPLPTEWPPAPREPSTAPFENDGGGENGTAAADRPSPAPPANLGREEPKSDDRVVVLAARVPPQSGEPNLVAMATEEKQRRQSASPSTLVLTDDNLAAKAKGGRVTLTEAAPRTASGPESEAGDPNSASLSQQELYWRSQARTIRERARTVADRIPELEERAAKLRTAFYLEDDSYRRDRDIKPQWDRSLDSLAAAKREIESLRSDLVELLEAGRRAGALPGWLREGVELEPPGWDTGDAAPAEDASRRSGDLQVVEPGEPTSEGRPP